MITNVVGIIIGFFNFTVLAQESKFEKSYQDYVFVQSKYTESRSAYQQARDTYEKNGTLSLKENARQKTYQVLINREDLLVVYLTSLKVRLFENSGLNDASKTNLIDKIDNEIKWLNDQKNKYQELDTLEDLFNKSNETKSRYETTTSVIIYDSLFNIVYGDLDLANKDTLSVFNDLKSYIDRGVVEEKLKIDPFDKWFVDIDRLEAEIVKNQNLSVSKIGQLYSQYNNSRRGTFESSLIPIVENIAKTIQLNEYTVELLNAIRAQSK